MEDVAEQGMRLNEDAGVFFSEQAGFRRFGDGVFGWQVD